MTTTTTTSDTLDHLPDMTLRGVDHNGTERQIGIEQGHLVGDAALITRLALLIEQGVTATTTLPMGLATPEQAYASLRALFQHVSTTCAPDEVI